MWFPIHKNCNIVDLRFLIYIFEKFGNDDEKLQQNLSTINVDDRQKGRQKYFRTTEGLGGKRKEIRVNPWQGNLAT